jgi:murein DD-endopeptidase MepM/ murein hydrolase activator NlpD
VQDPRGYRAALSALIVALLWPGVSQAIAQHQSAKQKKPAASAPSSSSKESIAGAAKASRSAQNSKKRRAKRVIRQDADSKVVLEWFQATALRREVYGPFLPPSEPFDYPPAPCQPVDTILEAHLHDESPDTPEAEAAEEAPVAESRESRAASFLAVARRIGSFLRPKSAEARVSAEDVDLADLLSANLKIPVEGVDPERLRDSFLDRRGRYRKHLAIDIGAPRGTPIVATAEGEIVRLAREKRGGITIYQKDASGKYLFFYCHLKKYAPGLAVGQRVSAGEVIGYVGSTGHVIGGPHLHFSITRVPEDDDFRAGLAINPYLLFLAGVP